jgi:hypothetical protein
LFPAATRTISIITTKLPQPTTTEIATAAAAIHMGNAASIFEPTTADWATIMMRAIPTISKAGLTLTASYLTGGTGAVVAAVPALAAGGIV